METDWFLPHRGSVMESVGIFYAILNKLLENYVINFSRHDARMTSL